MPVRPITHAGLAAVELTTPALRLVAVHGIGPRIAWLSKPDGQNLLLWDGAAPPKYVRTAPGKAWALRGGHRVWTARGVADESEETYRPDDAPGTWEAIPGGFVVWGAEDPETRTTRGIAVTVLADDRLQVDNLLVNRGDMLYSCGLWGLTCTVPDARTRYVVPLGDGTSFDTATITLFRCWAGHGTNVFADDQWQVEGDAFVLTSKGREGKRMVGTALGAIAMCDPARACTFVIQAPQERNAVYPANANLALYTGPGSFMVEMETMGPMALLKPGERTLHRQTWRLIPRAVEPTAIAVRAAIAG